jgi:hypothetical protein
MIGQLAGSEVPRLATGSRIHYAEQGDAGGEPILFLPAYATPGSPMAGHHLARFYPSAFLPEEADSTQACWREQPLCPR